MQYNYVISVLNHVLCFWRKIKSIHSSICRSIEFKQNIRERARIRPVSVTLALGRVRTCFRSSLQQEVKLTRSRSGLRTRSVEPIPMACCIITVRDLQCVLWNVFVLRKTWLQVCDYILKWKVVNIGKIIPAVRGRITYGVQTA